MGWGEISIEYEKKTKFEEKSSRGLVGFSGLSIGVLGSIVIAYISRAEVKTRIRIGWGVGLEVNGILSNIASVGNNRGECVCARMISGSLDICGLYSIVRIIVIFGFVVEGALILGSHWAEIFFSRTGYLGS